ncbi:PAS domain-containing sensor histidine kinase [Marinobacterium aestuariivivens]|uniref:histidine kinase n=1 Tax=Marinobacterium aestuariivivens TaxID=1698799 RepID=A0ABW2A8X0_9GAMM
MVAWWCSIPISPSSRRSRRRAASVRWRRSRGCCRAWSIICPRGRAGQCRRRTGGLESALYRALRHRPGAGAGAAPLRRAAGGQRCRAARVRGSASGRHSGAGKDPGRRPGAGGPHPSDADRRLRQYLYRHHRAPSLRRNPARKRAVGPADHRPCAGADRLCRRGSALPVHQQGLRRVVWLATRGAQWPADQRGAGRGPVQEDQALHGAGARGESVTFEIDEKNVHGEVRCMLKSYVPNLDSSGRAVGIFVMIRDITERRRTAHALEQAYQHLEQRVRERTVELTAVNDQLRQEIHERVEIEARLREAKKEAEQANLSKTKFLAAVSHDLLQPLNAARLFTGALQEQAAVEPVARLVRSVSNSLADVESLLSTLVDISKLDAGVITPDINAFCIRGLLENIANEYRQVALGQSLALHFVPSSAVVQSDSQLLARILRNFLSNALRYTRSGRILFGCRRKRSSLLIEVWDTGIGIPEEKLTEIFLEFRRIAPAGGAQPDKGLGLGLAIVDKISRILGHQVAVTSVEGRGSVFSVEVPFGQLSPVNLTSRQLPQAPQEWLEGARIWVVDNDQAICEGMATLLGGGDAKSLRRCRWTTCHGSCRWRRGTSIC